MDSQSKKPAYIFSFDNTNKAIQAEKQLLANGVNVSVMPLPSAVKAGCGICLRVRNEEYYIALKILGDTGNYSVYSKNGTEYTAVILP